MKTANNRAGVEGILASPVLGWAPFYPCGCYDEVHSLSCPGHDGLCGFTSHGLINIIKDIKTNTIEENFIKKERQV